MDGSSERKECSVHLRVNKHEQPATDVKESSTQRTFILGEDIDLSLELSNGLHRTGSDEDHSTVELFTLDTTKESTHVVTGLTLLQRQLLCKSVGH